jgi:hypothetical protein
VDEGSAQKKKLKHGGHRMFAKENFYDFLPVKFKQAKNKNKPMSNLIPYLPEYKAVFQE